MKTVTTKTRHLCAHCHKLIIPKSVARKERKVRVFDEDDEIFVFAQTFYYHLKCATAKQRHIERFVRFAERCSHPKKFQDTEYSYIPGEAVMQIEGDRCGLCAKLH